MNRTGIGDIVAAEMNKIVSSDEHARLFSKADQECKCPSDCDCKAGATCSCKGKCSKGCKACEKTMDVKPKETDAKSFANIVDTLTSVSQVLDDLGFRKSAIATLEALDSAISELPINKTAQTMVEDLAQDDDMIDMESLDQELGDQDLGDLGELEELLDETSGDMEDANDARLLDELGLAPLEEDPELAGAFSQKLSDREKELLQHIGGEGFEEEAENETDIDELLGNTLTERSPSEGDFPTSLPRPAKLPLTEEEMQEEFEAGLASGKRNPYFMAPDTLKDPSINMSEPMTADREKTTIVSASEVRNAFEKLDLWISKHAHEFEDEDPGFTYGPSDNDKIRLPGGDFVNFESLSPEERLEQEMGAGLHEQLDIDPDELSYEDVSPEDESDEDYWPVGEDHDDADDEDCMYDDDGGFEDE